MTEFGLRIAESPNTVASAAPEPDGTIRLSQLLAVIRRRRQAILVPMAIWMVLGVVYLVTTPRTYVASSTLLLDAGTNPVVAELAAMDDQALSEGAIENARLVIQSDPLATAVVETLALDRNEGYLEPPQSLLSGVVAGVIGVVRAPINLLRAEAPQVVTTDAAPTDPAALQRARVARDLGDKIGVERIGRSGAISVYFSSHDPVIAADVVNAYAEAYIADVLNANFESTERTTEWLQNRLSDLEAAASAAAAEAEAYRTENGLVSAEGRFMSEDAVSNLNANLAEAIAETARTRAVVEGYEAVVARGIEGLQSAAAIGTETTADPALEELQSSLADAIADLNRITANYGSTHPQAQLLSAEIETAAARLFVLVQQRLEGARGDFSVAEARVAALRESLGQAVGDNAAAGTAQVGLRALEQRAETLSMLYQTFLTRFQEIDQQRDFPIADVRILTTAEVPRSADGPRASRTLAIALVMGLLFGVALVAFREWNDRFLRTGEDVIGGMGLPFLGYLPETDAASPARGWMGHLVDRWHGLVHAIRCRVGRGRAEADAIAQPPSHDRSIYIETLQNIRLGMDIVQTGGRRQILRFHRSREGTDAAGRGILGVTSVRPGEGKSTVALNLAGMLAQGGASVLLIDADLRRSGLSGYLDMGSGPSIVDVALGRIDWADAVRSIEPPGLDVLPCVRPSGLGHVSELLTTKAIRALFEEAPQRYDHVVVDLAPLGPVVDARMLMRSLGHVLLVAEWGATPKAMLRKVVESDPFLAERLLGVVLNRVDIAGLRDYVDPISVDAYLGEYGAYMQ
jgi:polysaccharide biosynthesis transport protein